jgi:hypothetical protein
MRSKLRAAVAASAVTVILVLGPAVRAQDTTPQPTPGPFCSLYSPDELSSALGVAVTPTSWFGALSCTWQTDSTGGSATSLYIRFDGGTIAETIKGAHPGGKDLSIGGNTAYYALDILTLWMEAGGHLLAFTLQSDAAGLDAEPVLTGLAEVAAGRLDVIALPTPRPQPSLIGDPELVDLFPDELLGQPVQVSSFTGPEMVANSSGGDSQATMNQLIEGLASLGKSIDDLSFGFASVAAPPGGALIAAVRVRGADAAVLEPLVRPLLSGFLGAFAAPQETATQVAGKDVTMITDGPPSDTGAKAYIYPKNDVVWLVDILGTGLAIEDVIATLP